MAPRFSRPRLIDDQDRQYRAYMQQIMLTNQNRRATRPPRARDLFGGEAEVALRGWLSERMSLSDRRIVEYMEHRGRSAIKKYRELDAVALPDAKTIHVFEIKASQKATSLRRARQQLGDTRDMLKLLFAKVFTTILLVDTGIPQTTADAEQQAADLAARYPDREPPAPLPTLDEVLASAPTLQLIAALEQRPENPEVVGVLRFSVDAIIELAGAENLHLDWDSEEEDEEIEPELERHTFTSGGDDQDDDDDNPLAAALRKAMGGG